MSQYKILLIQLILKNFQGLPGEYFKNIVCEKPLALDSRQGKDLLESVNKVDLLGALNSRNRFYPLIQQIKAMIGLTYHSIEKN